MEHNLLAPRVHFAGRKSSFGRVKAPRRTPLGDGEQPPTDFTKVELPPPLRPDFVRLLRHPLEIAGRFGLTVARLLELTAAGYTVDKDAREDG